MTADEFMAHAILTDLELRNTLGEFDHHRPGHNWGPEEW